MGPLNGRWLGYFLCGASAFLGWLFMIIPVDLQSILRHMTTPPQPPGWREIAVRACGLSFWVLSACFLFKSRRSVSRQ